MKFGHTSFCPARRILILAAILPALVLAGCGFDLQPVEKPSTPTATLSPTFEEVALAGTLQPGSPTLQEPAPIPRSETVTAGGERPAGTPTATITPWPNDTPTRGPSPTASRTPTLTQAPTRTRVPTRTRAPTRTPTITFTPTPPMPNQAVIRPGLMSKVVSPIQAEIYATTGDNGLVTVELLGEDGRIIARQVLSFGRGLRYVNASPEIPFEIAAVSEVGRLLVHSEDEFGRSIAISSVDLILLSVGRSEINPPAITREPFIIRLPKQRGVVTGGLLVVEGLIRPVNDSNLVLELTNEQGAVISTKTFRVDPPSGDLSHTPFRLEIPYKVTTATPVRLSIRQESTRISGTAALTSITITLEP